MTTETRWKTKDGGVVSVQCEVPEWPNKDADGETIYDNSHFKTEAEAWAKAVDDAEGFLEWRGQQVEEAKEKAREAAKALSEARRHWAVVREGLYGFLEREGKDAMGDLLLPRASGRRQ